MGDNDPARPMVAEGLSAAAPTEGHLGWAEGSRFWILVALPAAVFTALVLVFFRRGFFDDSFITLRYARNLIEGHGLTWNAGERPVEGITNVGWALIIAAAGAFAPTHLVGITRALGIVAGVSGIFLATYIARRALGARRRHWALLVAWHLALAPFYVRNASNGLESTLVCALVLGCVAVWQTILAAPERRGPWLWWAVLTGALYASRPDAPLFSFVGLCAVLAVVRDRPSARRNFFIAGAGAAGLIAAETIARVVYYGSAVPLPAYMKLRPLAALAPDMIRYTLGTNLFGIASQLAMVALVLSLAFCLRPASWPPFATVILLAAGAYLGYFLLVIPVMNVHWRFQVPVYAPMVVAAVIATVPLIPDRADSRSRLSRAVFAVVFGAAALPALPVFSGEATQQYRSREGYEEIGKTVADLEGLSCATSEAGALPFFSGCRTLDLGGLNDAFIAKRRHHDPDFTAHFAAYLETEFRLPDLYVDPFPEYPYAQMKALPERLRARYDLLPSAPDAPVYILRSSPFRDVLRSRLTAIDRRH
jgi:arabinofuranosyltransferase